LSCFDVSLREAVREFRSEETHHDRFPKKWLIILVFFLSAELPGTASGEIPAPGTGAPSAFNGTTSTISLFVRRLLAKNISC